MTKDGQPADTPRVKVRDVLATFAICERTLWRWISAGMFPAPDLRVGKVVRWRQGTLDAWTLAHAKAGAK